MILIEWILALLGHLALSCVLFNHVHAFASPYTGTQGRKITEKMVMVFAAMPLPILIYAIFWKRELAFENFPFWMSSYLLGIRWVAVYFALRWLYRAATRQLPGGIQKLSTESFNLAKSIDQPLVHGRKAKLLNLIPWNQITRLNVEEWEFQFAQLPDDLHGLRICQLSDLHFTGLVDRTYFESVVERANSGKPDLVVISGDIVDNDQCVDWIESVLSKLQARYGVYFVLGNHDLLVTDQKEYLERIRRTGMQHAANGTWHCIKIGAAQLYIAGNEIPWYTSANQLPRQASDPSSSFSILISHSPDQVGWAVKRGFDLMFAGHTHGGQIRLPLVGPIIAPSRYGIKYASGTFKIRNLLMHVSRGISGDEPIRINCPPELGFFTLVRAQSTND